MNCQIVVLISGRGSNLGALIEACKKKRIPGQISAVISSREQAPGLWLAKDAQIPALVLKTGDYNSRASYDQALSRLIDQYSPNLIALAGFMRILTPPFVHRYAGRLLNIHPSRLPKHRGLNTHQKVLQAGDATHGASVHFVTPELDGGPVILQSTLHVQADHTEKSLAADILKQEHILYPKVVSWFCQQRLRFENEQVFFDGQPLKAPMQIEDTAIKSFPSPE